MYYFDKKDSKGTFLFYSGWELANHISNKCFERTEKNEIYNVKKKIENKIQNFISTEIEWKPLNSVDISKDKIEITTEFLEALENDEDVQQVYTNSIFGDK